MYCTECGTSLSVSAKFCSSCGSRISTSEQEQIHTSGFTEHLNTPKTHLLFPEWSASEEDVERAWRMSIEDHKIEQDQAEFWTNIWHYLTEEGLLDSWAEHKGLLPLKETPKDSAAPYLGTAILILSLGLVVSLLLLR